MRCKAVGFRTEAGFDGLLAKGVLWGGNLAMLCSMLGTRHFPRVKGGILFVEDVNEHPYRVERCLLQLHQAGVLGEQKAVLLGAVSDYRASPLDRGYTLKSAVAYVRIGVAHAVGHRLAVRPRAHQGQLSDRDSASSSRCRAATCWWGGDDAAAPLGRRGRARVGRRRLQQQPVPGRADEQQHARLHLRRTLAALPRSDGVVRQSRVGLHLPDLRAALRLSLPEAPVRADSEGGHAGGGAGVPRRQRAAAARRRAGRSHRRERVRHPDPSTA